MIGGNRIIKKSDGATGTILAIGEKTAKVMWESRLVESVLCPRTKFMSWHPLTGLLEETQENLASVKEALAEKRKQRAIKGWQHQLKLAKESGDLARWVQVEQKLKTIS